VEYEFLQAAVDALASNIAVLDKGGTIVGVNRAWCRFADINALSLPDHGLGADYLRVCDAAGSIESACAAGDGIRQVLSGRQDRFQLRFQTSDADAERWNRMTVTGVDSAPEKLAVVAHEIIDEVVGSRAILDFEDLAAELSAAFVRTPADQVDGELDYWLERIVRALDIDRCVIGEINPDDRQVYVTHQWSRPGLAPLFIGMNATATLPWLIDRTLAGKLTVISRDEDMPPEASRDREVGRTFHFKSNVTIPLRIDDAIIGGVAFGTLVQRRTWSPRLVQRLRTVSQIFGNALDRKRSRLTMRRLREEVQELSRTTLMGELTASLAHELNQPLGAILNNAQAARRLLQVKKPNLKDVRGALNGIIRDDVRASETVRNVRELFKPAPARLVPIEPRRLIADAERILREDAKMKGIALRIDVRDPLPKVRCHRTQLIQVITNLLLNAFDAIASNGEGPREVVLAAQQPDAAHVLVSVADSGPGIASEVLPKIFNAFFTTRSQGMGMGLAIAKSIVENHGGEIRAHPNSGRGATLEFTLPVTG
jgi:signal transduction histidine kinase/PAS domain-containing protein